MAHMKILYLCSDAGIPVLGHKGASIHVRSLVSAFAAAGHAVALAAPVLTHSPAEEPAAVDAELIHIPPSGGVIAAMEAVKRYGDRVGVTTTVSNELRRILYDEEISREVLRRVEHLRPDFVYERATVYGTAGTTLSRQLGIPLIVELNAPLSLEQSTYRGTSFPAFAWEAERYTLSNADVVLTVSAQLRTYVIEYGLAPERVHVMPNGIDPRVFAPGPASVEVRERWRIGVGPVLGFIGGLRPWHGLRALPALVERLAQRYPDLQLIVGGEGPLREELQSGFRARGVAERVCFTGPIAHEEVAALVRTFDVALAPYDENDRLFYFSPLKLFEYMGCGVPVVAASLGQIPEVVRDGEDGLLYAPGDVDGLAAACERLLQDPPLGQRLGRNAAARVRERFTWSHNAARIISLAERASAA
jgi:glycosyltransferase involved in cell wall biosynthesis